MMPLLLHGVLDASIAEGLPRAALREAAGRAVEVVPTGGLAAVVSHSEADEAVPSRANLMAHTRLLELLGERTTVAPMRFGVIAADHEAVRAELATRGSQLREVLQRLEGHLELRLRGRYEQDAVLREVLAGDRRAASLRGATSVEARMELGERIVAGIEARRDADRHQVLQRLEAHVADVVVGDVSEPLDAFSVSLLVARSATGDFEQELEAVGRESAPVLGLELVGPVPPFSFVDVEAG